MQALCSIVRLHTGKNNFFAQKKPLFCTRILSGVNLLLILCMYTMSECFLFKFRLLSLTLVMSWQRPGGSSLHCFTASMQTNRHQSNTSMEGKRQCSLSFSFSLFLSLPPLSLSLSLSLPPHSLSISLPLLSLNLLSITVLLQFLLHIILPSTYSPPPPSPHTHTLTHIT